MDRPRRLYVLSAISLVVGCAGPPIPASIDGIPVCSDFTTGNAKMEGGLRYPVRLRVLDGKTVLFRTVIAGLRHADDAKPRSFIADDNARYTVEWAQCANPRAPRSASEGPQTGKSKEKADKGREGREGDGTAYDCGEATVYKGDAVLETRKGDKASHVINFVSPPDATCWVGESPAVAERDAGAASIPDAGASPPPDAGAATGVADAGQDASAPDAGAARVDAGGK